MDHPPQVPSVDSAVAVYRHRLDHLSAEGRQIRAVLATTPGDAADLQALRIWQRECAATISQLSGGSKAHWLSRAFSEALLVPMANGGSASVVTILDRLLSVLDSAGRSLADAVLPPSPDSGPPPARPRFTFVENAALRSGLDRAYLDGQDAFARGEFGLALMTFCSVLETVITDALERRGRDALASHLAPPGPVVSWPFVTRIATAEHAGLISRGCVRLPQAAREYRDRSEAGGDMAPDRVVSARDAKLASDVLHVILRDLAPGR
jgi:hypothetical protein